MNDDTVYARGYPTGAHHRLQDLIDALCPAHGIGIGRWDDRASWRLDAKEAASVEQIEAAQEVLASFDPWAGQAEQITAPSTDEPAAPIAPIEVPRRDDELAGMADPVDDGPELSGLRVEGGPDDGVPDSAMPADAYAGTLIERDDLARAKAALSSAIDAHAMMLIEGVNDSVRCIDMTNIQHRLIMGMPTPADLAEHSRYGRSSSHISSIIDYARSMKEYVHGASSMVELLAVDVASAEWPKWAVD